jgi:hypothetical protein
VQSPVRIDSRHAGILDAHLFPQQGDFLMCLLKFGFQSDTTVSPTSAVGSKSHYFEGFFGRVFDVSRFPIVLGSAQRRCSANLSA